MSASPIEVAVLDATGYERAIPELGTLLVDAVDHGAGVNFVPPLAPEVAVGWWRDRLGLVRDGVVTAIVAREAEPTPRGPGSGTVRERLVGCVLLIRAQQQNGPHRAEVAKLLVHSGARRRGIARSLMSTLESIARTEGRWLLTLDTETGTGAEATYRALGWTPLGAVPDFSIRTNGALGAATFFYKDLR